MRKSSCPILVTGSHRSGTTWAGKMMSTAPHVGYIHEPFNIGGEITVNSKPFKYWFQHVNDENSKEYGPAFDKLLHFHYPLYDNLLRVRTSKNAIRAMKDIVRDQGLFLWHKIWGDRPLIKDPIAFFSAEWLYEKFNANVLVLIRHPAAFCSSLKIKNWHCPFDNFLKQPILMKGYLSKFEADIRDYAQNPRDVIDQAILLWNCIYYTCSIYKENHTDWTFIRHEDLSLDPLNEFRSIFKIFDLQFSRKVYTKILQSSGPHNPSEQLAENEFLRDSKKNIHNWKKRLSQDEIKRIRMKTSEVASLFYSSKEW